MPNESKCHGNACVDAKNLDAWKWGHGSKQTAVNKNFKISIVKVALLALDFCKAFDFLNLM